jgi:hypothetical protein
VSAKNRARRARRPSIPKESSTIGPEAATPSRKQRIEAGRRRAVEAKAALGIGATLVFALGMVFARHSYAGHPKRPATPLAAPDRFVGIVRQNLLQAGIVAPAQAPPDATTGVS